MKRILTTGFLAALLSLVLAPAAGATFPGGVGLIAATSTRDGNEEIYSMDRNGNLVTRLTENPARDFDPSFSPDGSRIAFVSDRDGGDLEIYVMDVDGSNQTRLTDNAGDDMDPAWSPDGERLAIRRNVGGDNEIFLIDAADGGNPVNLTQNPASDFAPDFSPDGATIAFQRYMAGSGTGFGNEVMLMNADGSDQVNLTANDNAINDGRPSFSPDGSKIAFHSNRDDAGFQIFALTVADSQVTRVEDDPGLSQPTFSPDGGRIVAQQDSGGADQLAVIDVAESTVTPITAATGESSPAWQVDDVDPTVTIDSGPAEGSRTQNTSPEFEFSAGEPGSTFECAVDEADFSDCASPQAVGPLDDGAHSFSVRATDIAGNTSEPAVRSFTVDTVAPVVTFDSGPDAITAETEGEIAFSADEPISGAECDFEGSVAACTSPVSVGPLTDGDYTFKVKVTDLAGNVSDAAEYSWTIDTVPAVATIVSGPEDPTAEPNAWFQFTADDSDATFECRIDPGPDTAWTPCVSGVGYENLTDGTHHFQVRAVEPGAGPGPVAEASWTIDTVAPRLGLTATPASPTNQTDATFGFEMNKPGFTFTCQLDDSQEGPCGSPLTFNGLAAGDHSLVIVARDGEGEAVDSTAYGWTILPDPPVATITSGPGPIVSTRASAVNFGADVPEAVFECSFNQGAWTACSSPAVLTSPADGAATLAVRAMLPGEQPGPAVERQWLVDTQAPSVTLTGGPTGRVKDSTAAFTIAGDDPTADVSCRLDEGAWASCSGSVDLAGLADGSHVLRVSATDEAGNAGWARRDWTVDTTGPAIDFKSGPPASTTKRSARFSFASEAGATFECRLDGGKWSACTSPRDVGYAKVGNHRFEVRASDDLGNTGETVAREWTVTTPAPKGVKPTLKTFKRAKVNVKGMARIAIVGCAEGRCRVTAPHRVAYRLKGRKFTPGIRSPRGFYRERNSEIMVTMSPGARKVLAKHGPARVTITLKVRSDNGKSVTRKLRVTLTAR